VYSSAPGTTAAFYLFPKPGIGTQRGEQLSQMSALTLIQITKENPPAPADKRQEQVFVTDIFRNAATAKITSADWVNYLQLHRWHGRWVIVNVLWELKKSSHL